MPSRSAIRVIQNENDNPRFDTRREEAVLAAYQVLADTIGACFELTLDGQVVLYTGYFKPSLQETIDLHAPKYIEAREPTPEDLTLEELLKERGEVFEVKPTTPEAVKAYYSQRNNKENK